MKLKKVIIFLNLFFYIVDVFPSISGRANVSYLLPKESIVFNENEEDLFLQSLKKEIESEQTRSINLKDSNISFDKVRFYLADYFYLGADPSLGVGINTNDSALLKAYIQSGAVEFANLAPETVYMNGETENGNYVKVSNPIYNNRVTYLALQSIYPVLTLKNQKVVGDVTFNESQLVCLLQDVETGESIKTNIAKINDANGSTSDGIVGLEGSPNKIIAAVKPNGGNFGEANSGFAILIQDQNVLKTVNAQNGEQTGNKAAKLDLDADQLIAITQAVTVGELGDMYWDSTLNRLFIGLIDVTGSAASAGGAVAILVGRFSDYQLILEPIVSLDATYFTADSDNFIFGFYHTSDATSLTASVRKIRTMNTSTGKAYIIANAEVGNPEDQNTIYAMPIIQSSDSGDGSTDSNIGKISKKSDTTTLVDGVAEMTKNSDDAAKVGGGSLPIASTDTIKDIYISGDTVFVAIAEDRSSSTKESGIFRSSAIFDSTGKIRSWSSWQRVMGSVDKVYGFGIDYNTENFWYLTDDGSNKNTVKITQWGESINEAGMMGNGLVDLLSEEFLQTTAGVHKIFNFDEKTPSLSRNAVANEVSMLVALGYSKVALIQTGKYIGSAFTPIQDEFVKSGTPNVFIFDDNDLNDFGPINCTDISRVQETDKGWLFVGGFNGLAVLRKTDGTGWDGDPTAASAVDFDTIQSDFTFKELLNSNGASFSKINRIICQGNSEYLYAMTLDKLYRIKMDANKFKDIPDSLAEKEISIPSGTLLDMIIFYRAVNDTRLLVATTEGLFYSNAINDTDENKSPSWTKVKVYSDNNLSGPVLQLSFIDVQKGGYTTNGNVYALVSDLSLDLASIYRFNIKDGIISAISENAGTDYFYSIGEYKTRFLTDGAFGFLILPKHFSKIQFLKRIRMLSSQRSMRSGELEINLDLSSDAYNIGNIVLNTASGGWVVAGDWGIRVNE